MLICPRTESHAQDHAGYCPNVSELVVVTGGAGFIGSHIVDELSALGLGVRVLDVLHPLAHDGPPDYLSDHAEYIWGDIGDFDTASSILDGADAVCHQASMVGLGVNFADAPAYAAANDLGTATLLAAMHAQRFSGRLVLASSMAVYGEGRYRCTEHGHVRPLARAVTDLESGLFEPRCPECSGTLAPEAIPESAAPDPRNIYSATKLHQEHLCHAFAREHDVAATSLRYHNVYGPRMPRNTPYAGVASIFRSAIEAGQSPRVFEDGGQIRDFVHVRDVAHANVLALTSDSPRPGVFNIASGTPHTVGEMAAELCDAFASDLEPQVCGEYRLGDVRHVFASPDAAAAELGFSAEISFTDGMKEFATAPLRDPATQ